MLEIMGEAGIDIWHNRVRYGLDGADVEWFSFPVKIVYNWTYCNGISIVYYDI